MDPPHGRKKRRNVSSHKWISKSMRFTSLPGRKRSSFDGLPPSLSSDDYERRSSLQSDLAHLGNFDAVHHTLDIERAMPNMTSIAINNTTIDIEAIVETEINVISPVYDASNDRELSTDIVTAILEEIVNRSTLVSTSTQQAEETIIANTMKTKSIMKNEFQPSERRDSLHSSGRQSFSLHWKDEATYGHDSPPGSLVLGVQQRWAYHHMHRRQSPSITSSSSLQMGHLPVTALLYPLRRAVPAPRGTRVELHVHLVGAMRPATIWELMKDKKLKLPGDGSLSALRKAIKIDHPSDVCQYTKNVLLYVTAIAGDRCAIERVAFELCEDKVKEGVLYFEARYSPDLLTNRQTPSGMAIQLKVPDVVAAITRSFNLAERELGICVRSILCITTNDGSAAEILKVSQDFRDQGVVGIDLTTTYEPKAKKEYGKYEEVPLWHEEMRVFNKARLEGVHRTVHAGLIGGANMVNRAVEKYHAERIGHGYSVVDDPNIYSKCLSRDIHFECCPWESVHNANGPQLSGTAKHPITRFAEDDANFSLSTSHPSASGTSLQQEYDIACTWGLTELHLVRSNINALRSCFLNENKKKIMMQILLENLGFPIKQESTKPAQQAISKTV